MYATIHTKQAMEYDKTLYVWAMEDNQHKLIIKRSYYIRPQLIQAHLSSSLIAKPKNGQMIIFCVFCEWTWVCASDWHCASYSSCSSSCVLGGVLGLKAGLSVGGELAVGGIVEECEGGGGDAGEGEELFLGVDVDLDVVEGGVCGRDVAVPSHVDVAVVPSALQVERLQVVYLSLQLLNLSLNRVLLLEQSFHAPPLQQLISHSKNNTPHRHLRITILQNSSSPTPIYYPFPYRFLLLPSSLLVVAGVGVGGQVYQ